MSVVEGFFTTFWSQLAYGLIMLLVGVIVLFVWEFIYADKKDSSSHGRQYGTGGPQPLSPRYTNLPAYELTRSSPSLDANSVQERLRRERGE